MRIRVQHDIRFRFDKPVKALARLLRLVPRNHEGQHVTAWRLDADADCRLRVGDDAYGNLTHVFNADGPIEAIDLQVTGEVETFDSGGVLRGAVERFPPELFLRDTAATFAEIGLRRFASEAAEGEPEPLGRMHALLDKIAANFAVEPSEEAELANVNATFERVRGDAGDLAQVFVAAARHLGVPARFVAGYCATESAAQRMAVEGLAVMRPAHAWAEAHVTGLGWVGFDPSQGLCPQDRHIRIATGLDRLDAAPLRTARAATAVEQIESEVRISCIEDAD